MAARLFMKIFFLPRTILDSEVRARKEYFKLSGDLGLEVSTTFDLDLNLEDNGDLACSFVDDLIPEGLGEEVLCEIDLGFLDIGLDESGINHGDIKEKCRKLKGRCLSVLETFALDFLPQCSAVAVKIEAECGTYRGRKDVVHPKKSEEV